MRDMGTQQFVSQNCEQYEKISQQNGTSPAKPAIERGASWSYGETKILLALWGQDMVQRQLTNSKRTRHVWEKIAERIRENGYDRTSDQVRTRIFNMIAEYRRILKNPTPERKKKCIFFDALHKIYQAKDTNSLESAIRSYGDYGEQYNFDPIDFTNEESGDYIGDDNSDNDDQSEIFSYAVHPHTYNNDINENSSNDNNDEYPLLPPPKRARYENSNQPSDAFYPNSPPALNHHSSTLDHSSSALLIDRMFVHLSHEVEVMREWVSLERERLAQEILRRKEEKEREERRETSFLQVLTKLQDQVFNFLAQHQQTTSTQTTNSINNTISGQNDENNSSIATEK